MNGYCLICLFLYIFLYELKILEGLGLRFGRLEWLIFWGFKTKTLLYLIKEKKSNGQSVWSEMGRLKKLFEEPKSKSELKIILARYKESIKYDGGAVLFAVCRGKVYI